MNKNIKAGLITVGLLTAAWGVAEVIIKYPDEAVIVLFTILFVLFFSIIKDSLK